MARRAKDRDEGTTDIGMRIKRLRTEEGRNWTQETLAGKLGATKGAVSQWEKGDIKNMQHWRLFKMADLFGCEARWLALGDGPETPPPTPQKDDQEVMEIARWLKGMKAAKPAQFQLLRDLFTGGVSDEDVPAAFDARHKKGKP